MAIIWGKVQTDLVIPQPDENRGILNLGIVPSSGFTNKVEENHKK